MARIEWVEERLLNWARWISRKKDRGQGYPTQNVLARFWMGGRYREAEAHIPINDVEAFATHKAIEQLPAHLRDTVHQVYLTDGSVTDDAATLGCAVSTVHARVEEAHRRLNEALRPVRR